MTAQRARFAELDKSHLAKVHALEEELGAWVVALQPQIKLSDLSQQKLERLQAVERELGVVLLAYDRT